MPGICVLCLASGAVEGIIRVTDRTAEEVPGLGEDAFRVGGRAAVTPLLRFTGLLALGSHAGGHQAYHPYPAYQHQYCLLLREYWG